ncbi:hypothetical protein [Azospirillum oryzae]|uniref:hypothetical protein n=1 Tax=Azospirillum oryzae TaxID=286727 RepID=UPI001178645F|nr:hypothetical protein [Azospirillum oryzae]
MYELRRITDPGKLFEAATAPGPDGPGFSKGDALRGALLVVEATSVNDPGPDFTRWKLVAADGDEVASAVVPGF